jgi:hypothetical protein
MHYYPSKNISQHWKREMEDEIIGIEIQMKKTPARMTQVGTGKVFFEVLMQHPRQDIQSKNWHIKRHLQKHGSCYSREFFRVLNDGAAAMLLASEGRR